MDDLGRAFDDLRRELADLRRAVANMVRLATVEDPAAEAGRATVKFQNASDGDFISAPLGWAEVSAGSMKTHHPLTAGQQVLVVSPTGELADGIIMSSLNWDSNPRPSESQDVTTMAQIGDATITVAGDGFTVAVGGTTMSISGDGLAIEGGQVTHNGTDIGDTHKHDGVMPGSGMTGGPF